MTDLFWWAAALAVLALGTLFLLAGLLACAFAVADVLAWLVIVFLRALFRRWFGRR